MPTQNMQGMAGMKPKMKNEKNVAMPLFFAREISVSTSPLSYSSKILVNTSLLVEKSSTTLQASYLLYRGQLVSGSLVVQMVITYCFYYCSMLSIQYSIPAFQFWMYSISALAERQSPNPIPIEWPTKVGMVMSSIILADVPEEIPLKTTMMMVVEPSSPPQRMAFRSYPVST